MLLIVNRDLMLVGAGRLAAAFMALVTIRAVTTYLTPEQYGVLALLIAAQTFCGFFLVNPIGQYINLHTHTWWDDGSLLARLKSYRRYIYAVSVVGGVGVFVTARQLPAQEELLTAVAMAVMIVAGTWNATFIWMLNMVGFRAASVLWTIITGAVGLASSVLLCLWLPTATAWFSGQAIGMAAGALGSRFVLRKEAFGSMLAKERMPLMEKSAVLTYCIPLAFATGLMWLQLSGYRFLIESYWGLAKLGFLAVGLNLAGQVWSLAESLSMQFFNPLFYKRISQNENSGEVELAFSDLLNTLVPVYFVLTGLLVLCAPYLLKVLVAPEFQNAVTFVMLGAVIELCRVLGNLLSNAAHARRKTISLALPYAAGGIVTFSFIYLAIRFHADVVWVGVSLIIGAMAMLLVMWFGMMRQVRFRLDYTRWIFGFSAMLVMSISTVMLPKFSGFGYSFLMMLLLSLPAVIAIYALLRKSPALFRLLNVKLNKAA